MPRKIAHVAAVATFATVGMLGSTAAAGAVPADIPEQAVPPQAFEDCPANSVCLWYDAGFAGKMIVIGEGRGWVSLSPEDKRNASSYWNNTGTDTVFGDGANAQVTFPPGASEDDLWSPNPWSWNDRITDVFS